MGTLVANITGGTANGNTWSIAKDAHFAIATMLAVAGLICFAIGWRLNVVSAEARARAHADEVRARLVASMNEGTLQVSPGVAPSSQDEAEAFVARTAAEQYAEARSALRNRHSVFLHPRPVHRRARPGRSGRRSRVRGHQRAGLSAAERGTRTTSRGAPV